MMLKDNKIYFFRKYEKGYGDLNSSDDSIGGGCVFAIKLKEVGNPQLIRQGLGLLNMDLQILAVINGKEVSITLKRLYGKSTYFGDLSDEPFYYYSSNYGTFYFRLVIPKNSVPKYKSKENEMTSIVIVEPYNIQAFEDACLCDNPFFFIGFTN